MSSTKPSIVEFLAQVDQERQRRGSDPELQAAVLALKTYQQRRFSKTYADLLGAPRYRAAASFFLNELYGPTDFTRRDAQFLRVAPAITRLFPAELVHAVDVLAQLHAVSERLDTAMADALRRRTVDARAYLHAWQATGQPDNRELQIALTQEIGATLDQYTRKPLIRQTLWMMRGPARAAGLGELQRFLEVGFDAFKAMKGASEFLAIVGERERALAQALFTTSDIAKVRDNHAYGRLADVLSLDLP